MLIERLKRSWNFLTKINRNFLLFFKLTTHLSTDIDYLISPLKDIMDGIDKKYECEKLN